MPVVNDLPETIYVRDINKSEGEAFSKIKKQFGFTSNNEVVKHLFIRYLNIESELNELKANNKMLLAERKETQYKMDLLKETFQMIKDL